MPASPILIFYLIALFYVHLQLPPFFSNLFFVFQYFTTKPSKAMAIQSLFLFSQPLLLCSCPARVWSARNISVPVVKDHSLHCPHAGQHVRISVTQKSHLLSFTSPLLLLIPVRLSICFRSRKPQPVHRVCFLFCILSSSCFTGYLRHLCRGWLLKDTAICTWPSLSSGLCSLFSRACCQRMMLFRRDI